MNYNSKNLIYSSILRRLYALIIDSILVSIPSLVIGQVIPVIGGLIVFLLYGPVLEASPLQATIGKHLMRIQVTDMNGAPLSFKAAILRNILKLFSSAICFIGYLFAFFNNRKQTLHDLLADSVIIDGQSDLPVVDTWMSSIRELFQNITDAIQNRTSQSPGNTLSKLERLQALRERGTLTEEEFERQKRKILAGQNEL